MAPPYRHKPKNQATRAHGRGHERERLGGPKRPSRMTPEVMRSEQGDDWSHSALNDASTMRYTMGYETHPYQGWAAEEKGQLPS